ncbi:MAG: hypothetical protein LAN59_03390 [Acidobacteriia bacterium]|nr:hypothetical protein [Terriglobia bacterium]
MNDRLTELLVAIVSYVTERDGYVTKTKLLKLVYLFDVEFYRSHGRIFSGFQWKYFHLGPWTREFDPILDQLVARGELTEDRVERPEFDAKFLRSTGPADLRRPFDNYRDEAILKELLDTWGPSPTGEILDYVYFRTEPMEHGVRSENLDFSRVLQQLPGTYKRSASHKTDGEIKKLRREFGQKMATRLSSPTFQFTEPRYDEEFRMAMEKLDSDDV